MTLENYYNLAAEFITASNKVDFVNTVVALKNSIVSLKTLRGNPTANVQSINNVKNQLNNQKTQVLTKLVSVREDLMSNNNYNSIYDSYLGADVYETVNLVNQNIDVNNLPFLDRIDSTLNQIIIISNFYNATKNVISANGLSISTPEIQESLILTFEDEAFFDDLVNLSIAAKDWNLVIIGFARLVGTNDTKAEIASITRGSLIMSLLSDHKILVTIGGCAISVMELVKQKLKIKEQQLEIEKLNLPNKKEIISLLEENAKINVNEQAKAISSNLIETFYTDENVNNKSETKGFLKKAVTIMINYLTKGLKIEVKLISASDPEKKILDELKELSNELKNTQALLASYSEKRILLVENIEDDESKAENNPAKEDANHISINQDGQSPTSNE